MAFTFRCSSETKTSAKSSYSPFMYSAFSSSASRVSFVALALAASLCVWNAARSASESVCSSFPSFCESSASSWSMAASVCCLRFSISRRRFDSPSCNAETSASEASASNCLRCFAMSSSSFLRSSACFFRLAFSLVSPPRSLYAFSAASYASLAFLYWSEVYFALSLFILSSSDLAFSHSLRAAS